MSDVNTLYVKMRHQHLIREDDDMAKAEDEPLGKLLTKLHKLKRGPVVLE